MAMSTCPKCESHSFEISENSPAGGAFKVMFVQCSRCGAVVGVQDYYNIGAVLMKQNVALKRIASQMGVSVTLD